MGKFIITEQEKRQILSKYNLLNEQEYAGPTPEEIKNAPASQQVAWRANQIQSQDLGTSYEDAEKQAYNELQHLFSPEEKVYRRVNELQKADPTMSDEDAETKARIELKVPNYNVKSLETISNVKQTTPQPVQQQGGASGSWQTSQGQNVNKYNYPRPYLNQNTSQQSTTTQGQNVVANQPTTTQSAPNYNVNYKVLTPQKLTNIRTQINSTGKGNTLTPEDLQALYTTISKLPNKK